MSDTADDNTTNTHLLRPVDLSGPDARTASAPPATSATSGNEQNHLSRARLYMFIMRHNANTPQPGGRRWRPSMGRHRTIATEDPAAELSAATASASALQALDIGDPAPVLIKMENDSTTHSEAEQSDGPKSEWSLPPEAPSPPRRDEDETRPGSSCSAAYSIASAPERRTRFCTSPSVAGSAGSSGGDRSSIVKSPD